VAENTTQILCDFAPGVAGQNAIRLYRKGQAQVEMVVSILKHIVNPPASWQDWQPTLYVLGPSDNKVKN